MEQSCLSLDGIIQEGPHKPFVRLIDFGESSLVFNLLFWSNDIFRVEQIKNQLRLNILEAFNREGIQIPFPQRDININRSLKNEKA